MNDIWRVFNCNNFFYDILRKDIKAFEHKYQIEYPDANAGNTLLVTRDDLFAVIEQQQKVGNYEKVFIESIITTENFLKDVSLVIYKDFPNKLTIGITEQESDKRESKLLSIIINSFDKDEMLAKLTEEKIRGIFYGSPTDFFIKDTAKIGLAKFFADNHHKTLEKFTEIIARRNIFIHNNGKVDRKYLCEVKNPAFELGNKAVISYKYLKETIMILKALSLLVTDIAVRKNYNAVPNKKYLMGSKSQTKGSKYNYTNHKLARV
ncbi:MAG: hypothetical protein ACRYFK_00205 [Janthinobacterium lividum]